MIRHLINEWIKIKEANLIKEINKITAIRPGTDEDGLVEVDNPTDLTLLYCHEKYAVFRLDANRSIKIYAKKGEAEQEYRIMQLGAERGISPNVYDWGPNFLVTELIKAPTIAQYLEANTLTKELTERLIQLLDDLEEAGVSSNQALEDIFLLPDGSLRAINIKTNLDKNPLFPKKMIKGMGNQFGTFLQYVKEIDGALFRIWSSQPDFITYVEKKNEE
ncbi:hypothetical protein [Paenibacillus sp. yr247]|uniref:hypothetical protein n=1 Tax=Paenibacillus sp. yr247 TaxID=1761880 RepID=UPI000B879DAB|nr:hypothetical protein [Paenibacillus sp. yr247]